MHRDDHPGLGQIVHRLDIRAICVTRDVVEARCVINDVNALFGKRIHDADHAGLVAGDCLGRKEERIPLCHGQPKVLPAAQLCRSRTTLALASGDDQHQVIARDVARVFGLNGFWKIGQHARGHARLDHPPHSTPQKTDRAPCPLARFGECLETGDVGGEGRGDDHAFCGADQFFDFRTDAGF